MKVTSDDAVKIFDFGLAKTMVAETAFGDATTSPTLSQMATQTGMLLGTAAYMSPEQARGKLVERRADIWAFGCVLYEMLTGKMAFGGGAITDTLAAVLRAEPDWSQLPRGHQPACGCCCSGACRKTRSSAAALAMRAFRSKKFSPERPTRV